MCHMLFLTEARGSAKQISKTVPKTESRLAETKCFFKLSTLKGKRRIEPFNRSFTFPKLLNMLLSYMQKSPKEVQWSLCCTAESSKHHLPRFSTAMDSDKLKKNKTFEKAENCNEFHSKSLQSVLLACHPTASKDDLQCIQAKISKTLDKRSALILEQIAQNKN